MSQASGIEAVEEQIEDDHPGLLTDAADAGVDVDEVIGTVLSKHEGSGFATSTLAGFASSAIRQKIESTKAEEVKGILMGCRDRANSNHPRRWSLVRSNGQHIEMNTWDSTLPGPDGADVDIPTEPAKVTLGVEYEEDYESYQGRDIRSVELMDGEELRGALGSVAISPAEIGPNDQYEVVVLEGTISYVAPQTIFVDGEPDHDGAVLEEDARGELRPHMEVSLAKDEDASLRGHFSKQKNGRAYFDVTDLEGILQLAYNEHDDPDAQAKMLRNGLSGTDVYMVGTVSSYATDRDSEGDPVRYIDVNPTALVSQEVPPGPEPEPETTTRMEADEGEESGEDDPVNVEGEFQCDCDERFETQSELNDHQETCEAVSSVDGTPVGDIDGVGDAKESNLRDAGFDTAEAIADASPGELTEVDGIGDSLAADIYEAAGGDVDESPDQERVEEVREDIETYCELTGEDIESLTVDDVNESISGVEAPDAVIKFALENEDAPESEPDDDSGGSTQLEDLLYDEETGLYHCPGDGCPGKASTVDELARNHVAEEHETGSRSPPQWLAKEA